MGYYNWTQDIENCRKTMNADEVMEVAYAIARKTLTEEEDWKETDPGFDDAAREESGCYVNIFRISTSDDSKLYSLLKEWYESEEYRKMARDEKIPVRSMEEAIRGYYSSSGYLYFVTGTGYAIYSADLLGGSATGRAKIDFERFIADK